MDDELNDDLPETVNDDEEQRGSISADLIRGHINTIILRTLYEHDKYGYEIINEIEEKSHGQYSMKQPTLYSALKRLEKQGYINAYWKTDEISQGGRRKYFTLTDSGREIAERNQAEWEYSRTVIDSLISEKNFDFSQQPPTAVDFKILKNSTSRVPLVRKNDDEDDDEEDEGNSLREVKFEEPSAAIPTVTETNANSDSITVNSDTVTEEKSEENQPAPLSSEAIGQTDSSPYELVQPAETIVNAAAADPYSLDTEPKPYIPPSDAAYVRTEEIQAEPAQPVVENEQPTPLPYAQSVGQTEQREPEPVMSEEERRRLHENYLRLISEPIEKKEASETPYADGLETDSLIYNNRPEPERDYRNLVNSLFVKTIKTPPVEEQPVQSGYDRRLIIEPVAPVEAEQVIPEPVAPVNYYGADENVTAESEAVRVQPEPVQAVQAEIPQRQTYSAVSTIRLEDAGAKANNDGLTVSTSDYTVSNAHKGRYNRGKTLFKSSLIIGVVMLLEFALCLIFKSKLGVPLSYPFVIFALACAQLLIFGVLFYADYGKTTRKPTSHTYLSSCIVVAIVAILVIYLFSLLIVDFSSAGDILAKIVIPCIIVLNVPLFATLFYVFCKK